MVLESWCALRIKANAGSSPVGEVGTAEVAFLCLFSGSFLLWNAESFEC